MPTTATHRMPARRFTQKLTAATLLVLPLAADAQRPSFPPKTGVPGVQHPMTDLSPLATFPVAGHPDWMAVVDDGVWVVSSSANTVVRLDNSTNRPAETITVAKPCSGLATGFGSLWIPSCGAHTLVRANVKTGTLEATIAAGPADSEGGITTGAGSVWLVTSAAGTLARIDPATNRVQATIALPPGSFNPLFVNGSVWVSSNKGNVLVRVDPATNRVTSTTPTGPMPRFLTAGAGSVWVLNQGDGTVTRVNAETGQRQATIPAGIPGFGGEIAYGAGSVWATVFGYPISRIDPTRNQVVQQWTGHGGDSIRCGLGSLWLTSYSGAVVWRLNIPPL